ncbi:hypothetical protein FQN54_001627 [Arachnomyces sp. PD_36]|nr:hypothetical protein FQN54_001627 [Arachnomyces sp. PD_36]
MDGVTCWACGYSVDSEEPRPFRDIVSPLVQEAQSRGPSQRWNDWTKEELSSMYFNQPRAWTAFFCALITSPSLSPRFQLSDARYNTYTESTRDATSIVARSVQDYAIDFIEPRKKLITETPTFDIGTYPFHERCWTLVERVIGLPLIKQNLDVFFNDALVKNKLFIKRSVQNQMIEFDYRQTARSSFPLDPGGRELMWEAIEWTDAEMGFPGRRYPALDPLNIPELRDGIREAKERYSRSMGSEGREGEWERSFMESVPYEIRAHILGYLVESPADMQNVVRIFGWKMMDYFWKNLIPKDIVFEYYDLVEQGQGVDWEFLYFTVMRLLETCHGLWNRRRIIRLLEKVKTRFLGALEAGVDSA